MRRATVIVLTLVSMFVVAPLGARTEPPNEIAGLRVTKEPIGDPGPRSARDYLVDVRLYSLRAKKQLDGTLQIGRFRDSAPAEQASFRRSIAGKLGTTVPVEHRVDGIPVYVSKGKKLSVAVWYRGRDMFVLQIREDYGSPKALIREALEVPA